MFEWHGWAVVVESPSVEDDEAADGRQAAAEIAVQRLVDGWPSVSNEVVDCRRANGQMQVWLAGCHNHSWSQPFDLFEWIARLAPGSYGVLYSIDHDVEDEWSRRVLVRGAVKIVPDEDLSPHVPVVEEADPTSRPQQRTHMQRRDR